MQGVLESCNQYMCTSVDIGASANLELVDTFCYLGDMLSVAGVADAAVGLCADSCRPPPPAAARRLRGGSCRHTVRSECKTLTLYAVSKPKFWLVRYVNQLHTEW